MNTRSNKKEIKVNKIKIDRKIITWDFTITIFLDHLEMESV